MCNYLNSTKYRQIEIFGSTASAPEADRDMPVPGRSAGAEDARRLGSGAAGS
jgi:hypothetical protein